MWDVLGNLASAGINFWNASENRNQQQQQNEAQNRIAVQNMEMQREFAQHGISWKVSDAVSAGLHPLIGAGAQAQSFSPITLGGSAATSDLGGAGQDISRAITAAGDATSRDARQARELTLEKAKLENAVLAEQLTASKMQRLRQVGPPMAAAVENQVIAGQGNGRIPLPRPGPQRSLGGHVISEEKIKQAPDDAPSLAQFRPGGIPLRTNPYFADAQKVEDRYGNIAEEIAGLGAFIGDLYHTDPVGEYFKRVIKKPWIWQKGGRWN